jgi:hypothetical protein
MSRNTISRITSRIDELTEQRPQELLTIVSAENDECARRQIEKLQAMGRTRFLISGLRRANMPTCADCTCSDARPAGQP